MTLILNDISDSSLKNLALRLQAGDVVAFPTETVYGLGAHAGLSDSVARVYQIKGRPSHDPLIVHCSSFNQTEIYLSHTLSVWQRRVYEALGRAFWPGPLTLIVPCNPEAIVPAVSAGTGWVGLRCPSHPVALRFLEFCACPVAAPSANLFGHVSPTTAQHVFDDFPNVDNLWIVDGGACGFGIESTVVRINADETLDILRRGGVGREQILHILLSHGLFDLPDVAERSVSVTERYVHHQTHSEAMPAPGQLLVHYSPNALTMLVSIATNSNGAVERNLPLEQLAKTVVIDFNGQLQAVARIVGAYRDLSTVGDSSTLAHDLFAALRWAETIVDGDPQGQIWLFDPQVIRNDLRNEIFLAAADRIYRAAAGKKTQIGFKPGSDQVYVSIR